MSDKGLGRPPERFGGQVLSEPLVFCELGNSEGGVGEWATQQDHAKLVSFAILCQGSEGLSSHSEGEMCRNSQWYKA